MSKGNTPEIDWPYNFKAAEERLSLEDIERQGEFFLKRALNINHAVAFVGSGVSAAYGRVSWGELCSLQIGAITAALDRSLDGGKPPRIERFASMLKGLLPKVRRDEGEAIRQAMQIAEQVWAIALPEFLCALQNELSIKQNGSPKPGSRTRPNKTTQDQRPEERVKLFRRHIKEETHDETMHIRRIFSSPFKGRDKDPIQNFVDSNIHPPDLERFHDGSKLHLLFLRTSDGKDDLEGTISAIVNEPGGLGGEPSPASKLAAQIAELLKTYGASGEEPAVIPPIRYYAFGLAIDLLRYALGPERLDELNKVVEVLRARLGRTPCTVRSEIIPASYDPLRVLSAQLRIKRFVTTNYDLEIERMLEHSGFHPTAYYSQDQLKGDQIEPIGNMGGRSREIILQKESAADFVDFAAGSGPYLAQVVHIHGRATEDHEIIVTERDYQTAYVGDEPIHITAREGFEILFGGNPIIFLGFGLSEDDVMRALREFAANNIRRNTSIIALRAATRPADERDAFTLHQYVQYRVYVLHYGFVTSETGEKLSGDPEKAESWLEIFQSIIDFLEPVVDQKQSLDRTAVKNAIDRIAKLREKLGNAAKFYSDGALCDIEFELKLLKEMSEFFLHMAERPTSGEEDIDKRLFEIMRRAILRTRNAVVTRALTARLHSLQREWQDWSELWFEASSERLADRRYSEGRVTPIHPIDEDALDSYRRNNSTFGAALRELYAARWYRQVFVEPVSITKALKGVVDSNSCTFIHSQSQLLANEWPRLFVILGTRGAGKGSALSDLARYGDFLLQPPDVSAEEAFKKRPPNKRYAGQFIATISFSSEIASVWDALTDFLSEPNIAAREIIDRRVKDKSGRVDRLKAALNGVAGCAAKLKDDLETGMRGRGKLEFEIVPRFLIVLHAFDLLFDKAGNPKNAEILEIYNTIVGSYSPIDWVFICRADKDPFSSLKKEMQKPRSIIRWKTQTEWVKNVDLPKVILPNRFMSTLYLLIKQDLGSDSKVVTRFESGIEQSASSRGHISTDDLIDRILGYWAERRFRKDDYQAIWKSLNGPDYDSERQQPPVELQNLELAHDFNLQEAIIRHLAIISVPVDAKVLAVSHEVWYRAKKLLEDKKLPKGNGDGARSKSEVAEELWDAVVELIQLSLAILCARGLAFRFFTPYQTPSSSAPKTALSQRYQVHRQLQLYMYRRMGSQNFEPADAFFFSVSLYASQTRELPTLSANAYAFLSDLVDELIDYPSPDGKEKGHQFDTQTRSRCLRAALGIARTLFSIGLVARFADLHEVTIPRPPRVGYFEHRRLVLRWMIVKAKELEKEGSSSNERPFYRDEIVWLYNECGVFSLAQGQCFDAFALLSHAHDRARKIDGEQFGPVSRRILTNLGACEINRGRLARARGWFDRIYKEEETEGDETVRLIAQGYRGLIEHVGGSMKEAKIFYDEAIEGLKKHGRSRSTSLFLCCRAELHRHRNDRQAAADDLRDALDLSRRAGYEDMARFAIVGTARLRASGPEARDYPPIVRILDEAEIYTEAMDIPLLRCEISYTRAIILLKQGEHTRAGRETTRAIRAATLNGLALRALAYRNLLADIHIARGWKDQGKRMKEQVKEAARNVGYGLLLQRISKSSELPYENRNFAGAKKPASAGEN